VSGGEVFFYHLRRRGVDAVLPELLERTLKRGWRAVVRAPDPELLKRLDEALWTFRPDAVVPHGLAEEPHAEDQPVLLTGAPGAPNGADALFLLGGADPEGFEAFARCVVLFEDADAPSRTAARAFWRRAKAAGLSAAYWRETEAGFEKQG
jgi:DNA polymerase-3 subunit chi